MFCIHCGKTIPDTTKFCPYCGGDNRKEAQAAPPGAQQGVSLTKDPVATSGSLTDEVQNAKEQAAQRRAQQKK